MKRSVIGLSPLVAGSVLNVASASDLVGAYTADPSQATFLNVVRTLEHWRKSKNLKPFRLGILTKTEWDKQDLMMRVLYEVPPYLIQPGFNGYKDDVIELEGLPIVFKSEEYMK